VSGRVLVGDHDGVYVIRFEGDVRLTLCASFDRYLDAMLKDEVFEGVLVDLSRAVAIDSTSLGVLAKLSISIQREKNHLPTLMCGSPDILRVLQNMGFDEIFEMVDSEYTPAGGLAELPLTKDFTQGEMRRRVIDAHKVLMNMNQKNHETFRDLVSALEAEGGSARCGMG
jgi:anti-anti-sigma factor